MPIRVLVVDDEPDVARTTAELLALSGFDAHCAHNMHEAIRVAHRVKPDVGVLDIAMPRGDGLQLAHYLGSFMPECKLIALTGFSRAPDVLRSRAAGFQEHLGKPCGSDILVDTIHRVCGSRPGSVRR